MKKSEPNIVKKFFLENETKKKNAILTFALLKKSQSFTKHLLTFLQSVLLVNQLLLAGCQTLTEVGRFLQNDNFGGPIRRLQVGNERSQKFKSVAQVNPPLTFHAVVLAALLGRIFRVRSVARRSLARRTRSGALGARSFRAAHSGRILHRLDHRLEFRLAGRLNVQLLLLLGGRGHSQLQLLPIQRRRIRRKRFAHQHSRGLRCSVQSAGR